jgi:hypothetical protein
MSDKLPALLFGEPVRGWSVLEGRVCHLILGDFESIRLGRAACGQAAVGGNWGSTVPTVPADKRACRTCAGWLPVATNTVT